MWRGRGVKYGVKVGSVCEGKRCELWGKSGVFVRGRGVKYGVKVGSVCVRGRGVNYGVNVVCL